VSCFHILLCNLLPTTALCICTASAAHSSCPMHHRAHAANACMQPDEPMQQRRAVRPPCAKPGRSAPAAAWRPAPRRPLPCNVCSGCRARPHDCDSCGRRADHVGRAGPCKSASACHASRWTGGRPRTSFQLLPARSWQCAGRARSGLDGTHGRARPHSRRQSAEDSSKALGQPAHLGKSPRALYSLHWMHDFCGLSPAPDMGWAAASVGLSSRSGESSSASRLLLRTALRDRVHLCRPRHQPDGTIAGASTRARQNGLRDGLHQLAQLQPGRRATGTRGVASSQKRSRSRCRSDSYHCTASRGCMSGRCGAGTGGLVRLSLSLTPSSKPRPATAGRSQVHCLCGRARATGRPDRETGRAPEPRHGSNAANFLPFLAAAARLCEGIGQRPGLLTPLTVWVLVTPLRLTSWAGPW